MDIRFNCDKCGQPLEIEETGAGQIVECPKCATPLEVPYESKPADTANPPAPAPPPAVPPERKCPACAEMIKAEAKICRFCGYDFVTGQFSGGRTNRTSIGTASPLPKILTALAIIVVLGAGFFTIKIFRNPQAASQARTAIDKVLPDITLNGEVFIVTKGGENIKLGLVPIALIPLTDIMPYLQEKEAVASNKIARLEPLVNAGSKNMDIYKWLKLDDELKIYKSGQFYFDSLPLPVRSTKTDADGKFQIQVPRSGSYALAAVASRDVGSSVERYYWLLQIDTHGESTRKVMLSNDNLYEGGARLGKL